MVLRRKPGFDPPERGLPLQAFAPPGVATGSRGGPAGEHLWRQYPSASFVSNELSGLSDDLTIYTFSGCICHIERHYVILICNILFTSFLQTPWEVIFCSFLFGSCSQIFWAMDSRELLYMCLKLELHGILQVTPVSRFTERRCFLQQAVT